MKAPMPGRLPRILVCTALLLAWPFVANEQWVTVSGFAAVAVIGALSLQLLTGFTGLVSLGQAAFFGIGAYVASALGPNVHVEVDAVLGDLPLMLALVAGNKEGWPLILGLLLAGACAGFVGFLLAPAAIRLSGIYLAIVTLGMIFAAQHVFIHWTWLTGGAQGVALSAPSIGAFSFEGKSVIAGVELSRSAKLFYLSALIATLTALSVARLKKSKAGRALQAIRDNETAAAMAGVDVRAYKTAAFVAADFIAGMAGALYGTQFGFAVPDTWDLNLSVMFLAMIIIGGLGLVRGAILGAAFVTILPPFLRMVLGENISLFGLNAPQLNLVVFGLAIVIFLTVAPGGLARMSLLSFKRTSRTEPALRPSKPVQRDANEYAQEIRKGT